MNSGKKNTHEHDEMNNFREILTLKHKLFFGNYKNAVFGPFFTLIPSFLENYPNSNLKFRVT